MVRAEAKETVFVTETVNFPSEMWAEAKEMFDHRT
jgi:hypothetical protein